VSPLDRRAFLRRSAALGAASLTGAAAASEATADDATTDTTNNSLTAAVAFDGAHQPGILTAPGAQATLIALDAIAADRGTLLAGLATLSSQARILAKGYTFGVREPSEPPPDSGMLGTTIAPDRLTTTIAFGASLFDGRYGLASRRPPGLTPMPRFADDAIDPDRAHGDVLVTIDAGQRDTVVHAVRELLRPLRGQFVVRWMLDGFTAADRGPTPHSARRNLFGFRDGSANPGGTERDNVLWDAVGGTFQVVRTIRMHTEFWDRVGLMEQQNMIGRTRDSGAPIGGDAEPQDPRYDLDPRGARIPLDAHIRLANPRTAATAGQRILRKSFNYHRGIDAAGQLDQGLMFLAYNRSIQQQFEVIQNRLAGEPMTDYVTPVGGGYFYAPRGTRGATDWVGAALLT
jgi:deferrochelatase/peroxidase EfeB